MEARLFVWQRSLSAFEKIYCNRLISGAANNYKTGKSDMEQYKDDIKSKLHYMDEILHKISSMSQAEN